MNLRALLHDDILNKLEPLLVFCSWQCGHITDIVQSPIVSSYNFRGRINYLSTLPLALFISPKTEVAPVFTSKGGKLVL